jgi:hypothetical protein
MATHIIYIQGRTKQECRGYVIHTDKYTHIPTICMCIYTLQEDELTLIIVGAILGLTAGFLQSLAPY